MLKKNSIFKSRFDSIVEYFLDDCLVSPHGPVKIRPIKCQRALFSILATPFQNSLTITEHRQGNFKIVHFSELKAECPELRLPNCIYVSGETYF